MQMTESQLRNFINETLANEYEWESGSKESFLLHKDGMEKSDKDNVEDYLKSMNMMESFIHHPNPEYIFERSYVTGVLGISLPLNESYPYSRELEDQIIEEQLLLEGFFSDFKKLGGDTKNAALALRYIMQDSSRLESFMGLLKSSLEPAYKSLVEFLESVLEKIDGLSTKVAAALKKVSEWATDILGKVKSFVQDALAGGGWKGAMILAGAVVGVGFVWSKLEEVAPKILEQLVKLKDAVTETTLSAGYHLFEGEDGEEIKESSKAGKIIKAIKTLLFAVVKKIGAKAFKGLATDTIGAALTGGISAAFKALKMLYGGSKIVFKFLGGPLEKFVGKIKNPEEEAEEAEKGEDDPTDEGTKKEETKSEALIRSLVREALLCESIEFRELDSPLMYSRARNVKRLALCDTSVKDRHLRQDGEPQRDAYFNEYQEWEHYGVSGRRLKKPRKGPMIPGVSDACIIGFLDFHKYGDDGWYIDYMKTRGDKGGQGTASKLVDEFFERYAEPGGMIHFGKMMRAEIGHLKDKMAEKYPGVSVIGAKNF